MSEAVDIPLSGASSRRHRSRKITSARALAQNNSPDSTNTDQTDGEIPTRKKKTRPVRLETSRINSIEDEPPDQLDTDKRGREKRRRSLRKSKTQIFSPQGDTDGEKKPGAEQSSEVGMKSTESRLDPNKSKFLKKPFKKPTEKTDSELTTKDNQVNAELQNIIHSYGTEADSAEEGENVKAGGEGENEPRKFESYNPVSDSSDEYHSDGYEDKTKDSYFVKGRIAYLFEETPTPHSHLDKLVDKVVGGGIFSAFPSEATFQRGHRLSVYDAVEAHLLRQGKKTFLFRTVLVASHQESSRELLAWHSKTIETINSICYDELATGFLLIYPRYFVHVLEGSEETLCKFLVEHSREFDKDKDEIAAAIKDGEEIPQFKTVKSVIIGFFNIRDRFIERWVYEKTKPYNRREHKGAFRKRLFEFLKCTFIMCAAVGRLPENHPLLTVQVDRLPDEVETDEDRLQGREVLATEYIQRMREIAQWMPSKKTLLDILKRKKSRKIQLKTPKEFIQTYWSLPPIILTSETDWPIPCRIAPYD